MTQITFIMKVYFLELIDINVVIHNFLDVYEMNS